MDVCDIHPIGILHGSVCSTHNHHRTRANHNSWAEAHVLKRSAAEGPASKEMHLLHATTHASIHLLSLPVPPITVQHMASRPDNDVRPPSLDSTIV